MNALVFRVHTLSTRALLPPLHCKNEQMATTAYVTMTHIDSFPVAAHSEKFENKANIERMRLPIGDNARVVAGLVVVDPIVRLVDEPLLLSVSTDSRHTLDGLSKVRVDRRPTVRLQPLQLSRCRHIETLQTHANMLEFHQ